MAMKIKQRRRQKPTKKDIKERERKARAKAKRQRELWRRGLLLGLLVIGLAVIISTCIADVGMLPAVVYGVMIIISQVGLHILYVDLV